MLNVPNIDRGPGSVTAPPRIDAGGDTTPAPRSGPVVVGPASAQGAAPQSLPTVSSAAGVAFTRVAWFDANGDGHIDPRSAASGGDATLLVPARSVELPTYARAARPAAGGAPKSIESANSSSAPNVANVANVAQTNRAVEAYQRYGQDSAPQAQAPSTPNGAPPNGPDAGTLTASPGRAVA